MICSLLHCGPSDTFCYLGLGHTKIPDQIMIHDDADDDEQET